MESIRSPDKQAIEYRRGEGIRTSVEKTAISIRNAYRLFLIQQLYDPDSQTYCAPVLEIIDTTFRTGDGAESVFNQVDLERLSACGVYDQRMFYHILRLANDPHLHIALLITEEIRSEILDYYFRLASHDDPVQEAQIRQRFSVFHAFDYGEKPSYDQPVIQRIQNKHRAALDRLIGTPSLQALIVQSYASSFSAAKFADEFGAAYVGCDPEVASYFGGKSGSRRAFHEIFHNWNPAGHDNVDVRIPQGFEHVEGTADLINKLAIMWRKMEAVGSRPEDRKVVLKIDDSFSGIGNIRIHLQEFMYALHAKSDFFAREYALVQFIAGYFIPILGENTAQAYAREFIRNFCHRGPLGSIQKGGVIEEWIEGEEKTSPSIQFYIDMRGRIRFLSTHEQLLADQKYIGAEYPARNHYVDCLRIAGEAIAAHYAEKGVRGHILIDFVVVKNADGNYVYYPVETNVRQGGTTHPYEEAKSLVTGSSVNSNTHQLESRDGQAIFYIIDDNVALNIFDHLMAIQSDKSLEQRTIDYFEEAGLLYNHKTQEGIVLNMLGAVHQRKISILCIAKNRERARFLYQQTLQLINTGRSR